MAEKRGEILIVGLIHQRFHHFNIIIFFLSCFHFNYISFGVNLLYIEWEEVLQLVTIEQIFACLRDNAQDIDQSNDFQLNPRGLKLVSIVCLNDSHHKVHDISESKSASLNHLSTPISASREEPEEVQNFLSGPSHSKLFSVLALSLICADLFIWAREFNLPKLKMLCEWRLSQG